MMGVKVSDVHMQRCSSMWNLPSPKVSLCTNPLLPESQFRLRVLGPGFLQLIADLVRPP